MKHHIERIGAATALTGALLNTVACTADEIKSETDNSPAISSQHESPKDSPRNRAARCILDANKMAILGILDSPRTVHEQQDGYFATYLYKPEDDPSKISNVMIDDSVDGQTSFVYYIQTDGENGSDFISTGKITLPVESDLAKQSLKNLDSNTLPAEDIAKTIDFKASGVTERASAGSTEGTVIQQTYTPEQAVINCDIIANFSEQIDREFS